MIDTKLLEILACPLCKGDVEYDAKNELIKCIECLRKYPVKDGIPVMLIEEADTSEALDINAEEKKMEKEIEKEMQQEVKKGMEKQ